MAKLVRDKIPIPEGVRPAKDDREFAHFVLKKIVEEAKEVQAAGSRVLQGRCVDPEAEHAQLVAELADVQDLIALVCDTFNLRMTDVLAASFEKARVKGGFDKRLIWWEEP